jgi:hypothetical protein
MRIPILGIEVDERFLRHRQRSTSLGGIAGAILSVILFEYQFFAHHVWRWDLLAVAVTMVAVKMGLMIWYFLTD